MTDIYCIHIFHIVVTFISVSVNGPVSADPSCPMGADSSTYSIFDNVIKCDITIFWYSGLIFDEIAKHSLFDDSKHNLLNLLFLGCKFLLFYMVLVQSDVWLVVTDRYCVLFLVVKFTFAIIFWNKVHTHCYVYVIFMMTIFIIILYLW